MQVGEIIVHKIIPMTCLCLFCCYCVNYVLDGGIYNAISPVIFTYSCAGKL